MSHQGITSLTHLNRFLKVSSISKKKEEGKAKSSASGIRDNKGENLIDNLHVTKMLYIDDFFFMLGKYDNQPGEEEHLFLTKGDEIKDHFKPHTETLAMKKVTLKDSKLIVTLGYDVFPEDEEELKASTTDMGVVNTPNRRRVIKVWNYNSLIMGEYKDYMQAGLTGGYEQGPDSPRIIEVKEDTNSPPMDSIDVSACGAYIGVVASRDKIVIHKAFPNFGVSNDKPIKTRSVELQLKKHSSQILDLFFFRDKVANINYIYVAASDMVYLLDTEKKTSEIKEISLAEMEVIPG